MIPVAVIDYTDGVKYETYSKAGEALGETPAGIQYQYKKSRRRKKKTVMFNGHELGFKTYPSWIEWALDNPNGKREATAMEQLRTGKKPKAREQRDRFGGEPEGLYEDIKSESLVLRPNTDFPVFLTAGSILSKTHSAPVRGILEAYTGPNEEHPMKVITDSGTLVYATLEGTRHLDGSPVRTWEIR